MVLKIFGSRHSPVDVIRHEFAQYYPELIVESTDFEKAFGELR